jgi:hypothetical protein
MKKLVILLVVFLFLGGGGAAAWWFLMREQTEGELAVISAEEATALISMIRVLRLDPIVLPVVREGQVTLHISAVVVIELTKGLEREGLREISEPLRDAMLSELYGIYAVRYVQERGYDIPIVRQRLSLAAERILGDGTVKSIRLQDITKRVPASG